MSTLLDLVGLKKQLNKTDTVDDDELLLYAAAAVDMVEQACGAVDLRTVTETVTTAAGAGRPARDRDGCGPWILRTTPVVAITGLTAAGLALDVATVSLSAGAVVTTSAWLTPPVVVSYTAGRAPAPPALQLAARIIGAHLWATQRGSAGGSRFAGNAGGAEVAAGSGWAIPNRAADLMRPWRRPPAIA